MLADPPSWEKGYEGLRNFVENVSIPSPFEVSCRFIADAPSGSPADQSLDIHRPELHPLLLPLFVHSYLDLVLVGYRDAADNFLARSVTLYSPAGQY